MPFDWGMAWLVMGIFVGAGAILFAGLYLVGWLVQKWDIDPGWFGIIALLIVIFIAAGFAGGAA